MKQIFQSRLIPAAVLVVAVGLSFGLFQNCSGNLQARSAESFASETPGAQSLDVTSCQPDDTKACSALNGSGTRACGADGTFGACVIDRCDFGNHLDSGACLSNVCTPNEISYCTLPNAKGTHACNAQGSDYSACLIQSCDAGYNLQNGSCVLNACTPNETATCSVTNGSGTHTCNAAGSLYTACADIKCNGGFNLQNGQCVQNVCAANSSVACTIGNGSGTKTCNSMGTAYGSCALAKCDSGYNLQNGVCVPNLCTPNASASCPIANGAGAKMCNATGTAYGSCALTKCDAGYNQQGSSCAVNLCTPGQAVACTIANGTGSHTCNAQGTDYAGSCQAQSCDAGYSLVNGACTVQTKTIYRYYNADNDLPVYSDATNLSQAIYGPPKPAFELFATPGPQRIPMYSCRFPANADRWIAYSCDTANGVQNNGIIGYAGTQSTTSAQVIYYCKFAPSRSYTTTDLSQCETSYQQPIAMGFAAKDIADAPRNRTFATTPWIEIYNPTTKDTDNIKASAALPAGYESRGPAFTLQSFDGPLKVQIHTCLFTPNGDHFIDAPCASGVTDLGNAYSYASTALGVFGTTKSAYWCLVTPTDAVWTTDLSKCNTGLATPVFKGFVN